MNKTQIILNPFPTNLNIDTSKLIEKYDLYKRYEKFQETETYAHMYRVSEYSSMIAEKIGLDKYQVDRIKLIAPFHDIGKLFIDESILSKKGKLTKQEFRKMKKHPRIGYLLLKGYKSLDDAAIVALQHHEKWNGKGYPRGLKGKDINILARIVGAADVFDALITPRSYKKSWSYNDVKDFFIEQKGEQFDPEIVDIVIDDFSDFIKMHEFFLERTYELELKKTYIA